MAETFYYLWMPRPYGLGLFSTGSYNLIYFGSPLSRGLLSLIQSLKARLPSCLGGKFSAQIPPIVPFSAQMPCFPLLTYRLYQTNRKVMRMFTTTMKLLRNQSNHQEPQSAQLSAATAINIWAQSQSFLVHKRTILKHHGRLWNTS